MRIAQRVSVNNFTDINFHRLTSSFPEAINGLRNEIRPEKLKDLISEQFKLLSHDVDTLEQLKTNGGRYGQATCLMIHQTCVSYIEEIKKILQNVNSKDKPQEYILCWIAYVSLHRSQQHIFCAKLFLSIAGLHRVIYALRNYRFNDELNTDIQFHKSAAEEIYNKLHEQVKSFSNHEALYCVWVFSFQSFMYIVSTETERTHDAYRKFYDMALTEPRWMDKEFKDALKELAIEDPVKFEKYCCVILKSISKFNAVP